MSTTANTEPEAYDIQGDGFYRQQKMYDGGYGKAYGNFFYQGCYWKKIWTFDNLGGEVTEKHKETVTTQLRVLHGTEDGKKMGGSIGFSGKGFSAELNGEIYNRNWSENETVQTETWDKDYTANPGTKQWEYQRVHKFKIVVISYWKDGDKNIQYNTSTGGAKPVSCSNEFEIAADDFMAKTTYDRTNPLSGRGKAEIRDSDRGPRRPIEPHISNLSLSSGQRHHVGLNMKKCACTDEYDPEE